MPPRQRRWWIALGVSVAVHVFAYFLPARGLMPLDPGDPGGRIDATFASAPPSVRAVRPPPQPDAPPAADEPASPPSGEAPDAGDTRAQPPEPAPAAQTSKVAPEKSSGQEGGAPFPRSARLGYVVTRGSGGLLIGHTRQTWSIEGDQYRIESVTTSAGVVALFKTVRLTQTSLGALDASGLKPRLFRSERDGRVSEEVLFNWDAGMLTLNHADTSRQVALTPGAQDVLSLFYQSALIVRGNETIALPVATGKRFNTYRLVVQGPEVLNTRLGRLRALHLKRLHEPGEDGVEIWLGLDVGLLPVRLRFTDRKGDVYDQLVDDLEIEGKRALLPGEGSAAEHNSEPTPG